MPRQQHDFGGDNPEESSESEQAQTDQTDTSQQRRARRHSQVAPADKSTKKKLRPIPDGIDVPKRFGWARLRFWLWRKSWYGYDNQPPKPGRHERAVLEVQHVIERREARTAFISQQIDVLASPRRMYVAGEMLVWKGLNGRWGVNAVKSSGKSTLAVNLANWLVLITHTTVLVLPSTINPGDGAMRSGASPKDTLNLNQLFAMLEDLKAGKISSPELQQMIMQNPYGVYVVSPDFRDEADQSLHNKYRELIQELSKHFRFIIMDGGNHLNGPEMAAVRVADQVVFTCFTGTLSTRYMLGETMDRYASDRQLHEQQRVEKSVVVINGLRPDETVEDYRQYATYTYSHNASGVETAVRQRRFTGEVLGVSWDDAINSKMFAPLEDQSPQTALDYLEVLYRLLFDTIEYQGIDLTVLERILEAERAIDTNVPFVEVTQEANEGLTTTLNSTSVVDES